MRTSKADDLLLEPCARGLYQEECLSRDVSLLVVFVHWNAHATFFSFFNLNVILKFIMKKVLLSDTHEKSSTAHPIKIILYPTKNFTVKNQRIKAVE